MSEVYCLSPLLECKLHVGENIKQEGKTRREGMNFETCFTSPLRIIVTIKQSYRQIIIIPLFLKWLQESILFVQSSRHHRQGYLYPEADEQFCYLHPSCLTWMVRGSWHAFGHFVPGTQDGRLYLKVSFFCMLLRKDLNLDSLKLYSLNTWYLSAYFLPELITITLFFAHTIA